MTSYTTLEVQNFKGIREMKLEGLGMVNVFVGGNNVGKTSVLQAIHLFDFFNVNPRSLVKKINALGSATLAFANKQFFLWLTDYFWSYKPTEIQEFIYGDKKANNFILKLNNTSISFTQDTIHLPQNAKKELNVKLTSANEKFFQFDFDNLEHAYFSTSYFSTITKNPIWLYGLIGEAIKQFKDEEIVSALKFIQPNLTKILTISDKIYCELVINKIRTHIDISQMGDGFIKLTALLTILSVTKASCIFIDEIENGFHHTVQKQMWELVLRVAQKGEKQIFFTTHSYEVLESLNAVLQEMKENGESLKVDPKDAEGNPDTTQEPLDLACVFRLKKDDTDKVTATQFVGEDLDLFVSSEAEIR